jgi:hypothetical protein
VTNYFFPQVIGQDSLLYLKTSYKKLPGFYLRTEGGEKRIKLRNISREDWLSYRNGVVAYTSYSTHPRWSLVDYSDIILLNMATGRETRLTSRKKYFTPDLSPNSEELVATYFTDSLHSELHLLNKQGQVIKRIPAPEQALFIQPRFVDARSIVVGIRWPSATMTLEQVDLQSGTFTTLVPSTRATLGFPFVSDGTVYFVSSLSGNDDLYALRLEDKKLVKLTSGQTGHYFPSVYRDTVTWSAFTANGLEIQQKALSELEAGEVNPMHLQEEMTPFEVAGISSATNILAQPTRSFPERKYSKSTGLFNFHSWRPSYEDPEFSFSLYSDNILNTFSNEIFYRYNENELSHAVGINMAYGGWFPVVTAGYEYAYGRHIPSIRRGFTLDQAEARIGLQVPLSFTAGKTNKLLNVGSSFVTNNARVTGVWKDSFDIPQTNYLFHFITWTQQLPRARQHIFPRLGYSVTLQHRHMLNEEGFQVFGLTNLFLPTPFANHHLVFSGSYQKNDTNNVVFSNRFANARGYDDNYISREWPTRKWRISGNYHFPLVYPDIGFANLVYVLRIRSNLFYDYSRAYSNEKRETVRLRSLGSELYFDTRWWNQLPVSFGFRYSHLVDNELVGLPKGFWEFILPLNLIPQ